MASNRFRYPPSPGNGSDTFSDNLVGNQITDGSSQMTMGTFSVEQEYSKPNSVDYELASFSEPITLESLDLPNLEIARQTISNNLSVFINNDTSDLSSFVLYGSLKKRLNVAVKEVINFFPAALFVDGVDVNYTSGNTTAYNIVYDGNKNRTTFRTNVNYISNPFSIEFTTNGQLLNNISPEQILNNLEIFGYTADTVVKVADGTMSKLRNLTKEFSDYAIKFDSKIDSLEYKVINLTPQTTTTNYIELIVEGNPFNNISTSVTKFYIKPNSIETEKSFKSFKNVEAFLMNRDVNPAYTALFKIVKETTQGVKYYSHVRQTWPLQDEINLDLSTLAYTDYLTKLSDIGDELDREKTNLVSRFLTAPTLKEFDTADEKVEKTLQMFGRSFDDVKLFVEGIAYMNNVNYDNKKTVPNELLKNFARTLGWSTPSTLDNTNFLDGVLGISTPKYSGTTIGKTPAELDIELYRNILMNTAYLFKSKGTRKSIEFLLTLLGAPEALIEFNEYVILADSKINMDSPLEFVWDASGGTLGTVVITGNTPFSGNTGGNGVSYYKRPLNKFDYTWNLISGGSYTTTKKRYSEVFSQYYDTTEKVTHPFILSDYPIDKLGYPKKPQESDNYFFQRGAGWFERTEEHKSEIVIDSEKSTLSGCTPVIKNKFSDFTWGGFWTGGKHSNKLKAPYLDRFSRFPHMHFGFGLKKVIDDKKSWIRTEPGDNYLRDYSFKSRDATYDTLDERLVINVKNIDLCLNIGQSLVYDVWKQSAQYNCLFSGGSLPHPYPTSAGTWDATSPQINAKKEDFKTFLNGFWKVLIDAKNRMTINDGKTGGYPVLQQMYLDYLHDNCGSNNQYTYTKMIDYAQSMGDYWIRIIEQMVPATTLWMSGLKVQNSVFHRDKFVYRCYKVTGETLSIDYLNTSFTVSPSATTGVMVPLFQTATPRPFTLPYGPPKGTLYYDSIISGTTPNPISSYATLYNISNKGTVFGSEIVSKEVNNLAQSNYTNKNTHTTDKVFKKQGATSNILFIDGFKKFGEKDLEWMDSYDLQINRKKTVEDIRTTNSRGRY
jgi:hypothetical protein|tara:strand:+ start:2248 stop:5421 length:3174 start_codon:yes stop_codon:yes gene_type:complete